MTFLGLHFCLWWNKRGHVMTGESMKQTIGKSRGLHRAPYRWVESSHMVLLFRFSRGGLPSEEDYMDETFLGTWTGLLSAKQLSQKSRRQWLKEVITSSWVETKLSALGIFWRFWVKLLTELEKFWKIKVVAPSGGSAAPKPLSQSSVSPAETLWGWGTSISIFKKMVFGIEFSWDHYNQKSS